MRKSREIFAWRLARHNMIGNSVIMGLGLVMIGFSLRVRVSELLANSTDFHQVLGRFDQYLTDLLITIFLIGLVSYAASAFYFARPLGRLIQQARRLRRMGSGAKKEWAKAEARAAEPGFDEDEMRTEDPGEWSDLERALNRVQAELRRQTTLLTREREELAALLGAVGDAIFAIDENEEQLFCNASFTQFFRPPGAEAKSRRLAEIFRVPEILEAFRSTLKTGEPRSVHVKLHTFKHALPRYFSVSIAPLHKQDDSESPDGGSGIRVVEGAIGVFHDVSELKQAEQIRIEFVGNASHELRTPLTSIKGYVDTLKEDLRDQRYAEAPQFLEIVSRNVDRLIFLVNDLLDLSIVESGNALDKQNVLTREVTESVFHQLEPKRLLKNQTLVAVYDVDEVLANPQRLEQVLVNLVHNAIKYTPEGSTIEVAWRRTAAGTELRVRDNGPGVALEHQPRLFERFYRIDAGRSREQGGTGLGLSIVKHIMLKHGGSVRVESAPGKGAQFVCLFP